MAEPTKQHSRSNMLDFVKGRWKRAHKQNPREVIVSVKDGKSKSHRFRNLFSWNSGEASTTGIVHCQEEPLGEGLTIPIDTSRPSSSHEDAPAAQSLWSRAYDALREDQRKLIEDYEELLAKYAQKPDLTSNKGPPGQAVSQEDRSRQARLKDIIAQGLQRLEESKTKLTIAGHEITLTDQIDRFAEFVLWAKDLIGEGVKQSPEASIIWSGVCIILPLLTNRKVAHEANRDGFIYVTARMNYYTALEPLLEQAGSNSNISIDLLAEVKSCVAVLYQHLIEFQIKSVLRFYQSSLGRYVNDVLSSDNWGQMRRGIEYHEQVVNSNLNQLNQFASVQQLKSLADQSETIRQTMQVLLCDSKEQLRLTHEQLVVSKAALDLHKDEVEMKLSTKQHECLQLFRITDNTKDATYEWYKDRVQDRVDGTCAWFLAHENYRAWLEQDSGPLLVSADPGCGKSVLAKYLIDHGLPRSPTTICYFFFKDQDQNTIRQALCALLHQLFSQKPSLIKHAMKQKEIDGDKLIHSTTSLWTVLENAVRDPQAGPVILVLDALDECAESEFENLMRNVESQFCSNTSSPGKLKYLLTSRPYEQITREFQGFSEMFPYVRIPGEEQSEVIGQEVNHVIKHRVEILAKKKRLSEDVKCHLAEKLLGISHRTYLWVYLVFDYLEKEVFKQTGKGIDAALKSLPKSVNEAYEQILNKSKEDPVVRKALGIVLAAFRPLTVAEMNVALNLNEDVKSFDDLDLETEDVFVSSLRSLCGLFISVHHDKIYFLHQTAREFLLALPSPATIPLEGRWQHSISNRDAHRILAEVCTCFLDLRNRESIAPNTRLDYPTRYHTLDDELLLQEAILRNLQKKDYTFFDYSATRWPDHFREACITISDASLLSRVLRLYDPKSVIRAPWLYAMKRHYDGFMGDSDNKPSLCIASYLGHEVSVKLLLKEGADIEARDFKGRTPLAYAAGSEEDAIIKLLLENGADIESRNDDGDTPLSLAAQHGNTKGVQLLLEKGADTESRNDDGKTPLSLAIQLRNDEAIVKLLLDKGADVKSRNNEGNTPLSLAIQLRNDEAIVKLLLDKGADVESRNNDGNTPLSLAALCGNKETLQLLLEKGAYVESRNNDGKTPLSLAAVCGNKETLQLLLEKGAYVESRNNNGDTPLSLAVQRRYHEEIVKLLLDKGAYVDSKNNDGDTPLALAVQHNYLEAIVKLLLDKGADVKSRNNDGDTPLALAVQHNYLEDIVKLLLDKGADVKSRNNDGNTPLSLAARCGCIEDIVKLLLDRGANIKSRNNDGDTPLSLAVQWQNEDIVKLLLDKGADVKSRNNDGDTPLLLAVHYHDPEEVSETIIKLLLDKGADVESRNNEGKTPLEATKHLGPDNEVRLLIVAAAKVKASERAGMVIGDEEPCSCSAAD